MTNRSSELNEYLETIQPDLMNVTRLFALPDSDWQEPARYTLSAALEGDSCTIIMSDGSHQVKKTACLPADSDPRLHTLHRRRTVRRLCKQVMYDLCREMTGIHPPWGSSTGVRPTHLMYEALAETGDFALAEEKLIRDFDMIPEKTALLRDIVRVQQSMRAPDSGEIDIYIGIPFCMTRCAYCSFSSGEIGNGKLVEPYLEALLREMEACAGIPAETGKRLRALYIGGGTPTSLNEEQLKRLLDATMRLFPGCGEYTVEAGRPDTLTRGKLRAIRESGANRISINPQTMVDRTLRVIGRNHTAAQVEEAYAMARAEGIGHINMDVIAGLPGEDLDDFTVTMDAARRLRPESLTVHTLAIKRSSRLALEKAPLPDGETASRMVAMGRDTAAALGLEPYYMYRQKYMAGNQENVGYALPHHACQYNVDMMEENTHILAMGAGSISKRIYRAEGHIGRAPDVSNIHEYIARVDEMTERKRSLFLSPDDETETSSSDAEA